MSSEIKPVTEQLATHVEGYTEGLVAYLKAVGLPAVDVVVKTNERRLVVGLLPEVIANLTPVQRSAAQYLSKFVAACVAGLFDAALNYLWDETVRCLRVKVLQFDLDYFFDTAIKDPTERQKFSDEADLAQIPDYKLIEGCRDIGIISALAKRHMDYIRDMRNHASAAHPNQNEIHGIQLSGWLQTCLEEVIVREPEAPAIEAKRLLRNIREATLDAAAAAPVCTAVTALPASLAATLLRSVFGMYTDTKIAATVRANIRFIAKHLWATAPDDVKQEIGLKHSSLAANADIERTRLARDFIDLVGGADYLSTEARALELNAAIESLMNAHNGWDNFYNETSPAKALAVLVPDSGNIPIIVLMSYVKALTLARIGNGHGVAIAALPTYKNLIRRWGDAQIAAFLVLAARDQDVSSRLQFDSCRTALVALAKELLVQTNNTLIQTALRLLITFPTNALQNFGTETRVSEAINLLVPFTQPPK